MGNTRQVSKRRLAANVTVVTALVGGGLGVVAVGPASASVSPSPDCNAYHDAFSGPGYCDIVFSPSDTTWTVPTGVSSLDVLAVGGGGGGGASDGYAAAGGGGGGAVNVATDLAVAAGDNIALSIGSGGAGGANRFFFSSAPGSDGGQTSVSDATNPWTVTASGGQGGEPDFATPYGYNSVAPNTEADGGTSGSANAGGVGLPGDGTSGYEGYTSDAGYNAYSFVGGGGGGAGGVGADAVNSPWTFYSGVAPSSGGHGGDGGSGLSASAVVPSGLFSDSTTSLGGGGGGGGSCGDNQSQPVFAAGDGVDGGGNGVGYTWNTATLSCDYNAGQSANAVDGTGGGGGGTGWLDYTSNWLANTGSNGGDGGNGVIEIRFVPTVSAPTTLYVNNDSSVTVGGGSCASPDFTTIADAVNSAASGDVVFVCAGTYSTGAGISVATNKSLTIQGEGYASTTLTGDASSTMFLMDGGDITLSDLMMQGVAQAVDYSGACGSITTQRVFFYGMGDTSGATNLLHGCGIDVQNSQFALIVESDAVLNSDVPVVSGPLPNLRPNVLPAPATTIDSSSFFGIEASTGAPVVARGDVTMTNTTMYVTKSYSVGTGAGAVYSAANVTLINDTFADNNESGTGFLPSSSGTIDDLALNAQGTLTLENTILDEVPNTPGATVCSYGDVGTTPDGNVISTESGFTDFVGTAGTGGNELTTTVLSSDINFSSSSSFSAENGLMPTFGLALDPSATVRDPSATVRGRGNNDICAASPINNLDQQGVPRPEIGGFCDPGAIESDPTTTRTELSATTAAIGGSVTDTATVTASGIDTTAPTGSVQWSLCTDVDTSSSPATCLGSFVAYPDSSTQTPLTPGPLEGSATASITLNDLTSGPYLLQATYVPGPDEGFGAQTAYWASSDDGSNEFFSVPAATSTTVTTTDVGGTFFANGTTINDTATVTAGGGATQDPSGGVWWYYCYSPDNPIDACNGNFDTPIGVSSLIPDTSADGGATTSMPSWTPAANGYYRVVAVFDGDSNYLWSVDAGANEAFQLGTASSPPAQGSGLLPSATVTHVSTTTVTGAGTISDQATVAGTAGETTAPLGTVQWYYCYSAMAAPVGLAGSP